MFPGLIFLYMYIYFHGLSYSGQTFDFLEPWDPVINEFCEAPKQRFPDSVVQKLWNFSVGYGAWSGIAWHKKWTRSHRGRLWLWEVGSRRKETFNLIFFLTGVTKEWIYIVAANVSPYLFSNCKFWVQHDNEGLRRYLGCRLCIGSSHWSLNATKTIDNLT